MKWAGQGGATSTSSPAHFMKNVWGFQRASPLAGVKGAAPPYLAALSQVLGKERQCAFLGQVVIRLRVAAAFVAARAINPRDRTVPLMIGLVAGITAGVILARGLIDSLLGHPTVVWANMAGLILSGAIYAALLAPLVVMPLGWVVKKFTPEVAL